MGGQLRRLGGVQRLQCDRGHTPGAAQVVEQGRQGMLCAYLLGAGGADDEQPRPRIEAQEVVQPLQRFLVAPLQIVDQQQQRLACLQNCTGQALEESLAWPILGQRLRVGQVWALGQQLWQ